MSRSQRVLAGPMAVGLAIALLTGCAASPPGSTSTASANASSAQAQAKNEDVCKAAADYNAAVTSFKNQLTPEVTIDQLRAARDEVVKTYAELDKASANIAEDRIAAVRAAERKLEAAVNDVRDQATVPEAVASLKDEASGVETALRDLTKDVQC